MNLLTRPRHTLRIVLASVAGLAMSTAAYAQWSTDSANNLVIADGTGAQEQSVIAATADGGCFIAWYDNSTGGYDVRLQRLDALGVEQWGHNGVLIADRGVSSTQAMDLVVDAEGNAIVSFNDDSASPGGAQQITVHKVDPNGVKIWPSGVTVTSGSAFRGPPQIAVLSDGNVAVGYLDGSVSPSVFTVQKVTPGGATVWAGTGKSYSETGLSLSLCDIQPGDSGSFIASWLRPRTGSSNKSIYTQKYDADGIALWNGGLPIVIFNAGNSNGIGNGYFPPFQSDGDGGAIYDWYEGGGTRSAYLQHVLTDGTVRFSPALAGNDATAGLIRVGSAAVYNAQSQEYFLAFLETNSSTQINDTVRIQKFDSSGSAQWPAGGATVFPVTSPIQHSFLRCNAAGDSCIVSWFNAPTTSTHTLEAAKPAADGQSLEWSVSVASNVTGKGRLSTATSPAGYVLASWNDNAAGDNDVQAQRINADGTLGDSGCASTCSADFDCSISVTADDIFAFLDAWFAQNGQAGPGLSADFNADQSVTADDIFAFLDAWFAQNGGTCTP